MEDKEPLPCADKLAFDTKAAAAGSAVVIKHQRGTKLRPYECKHCGLWHLASHYDTEFNNTK